MACPACMFCGKCGKPLPFEKKLEKGLCLICNHRNHPAALECERCGAVLPLPPGRASSEKR